MRSLFLIFLFPPIINVGRRWITKRAKSKAAPTAESVDEAESGSVPQNGGHPHGLPTRPENFDATSGPQVSQEPIDAVKLEDESESRVFDLVFLRWSLVVDGAFTTVAAFATKRWHIYLGTLTLSVFLLICISNSLSIAAFLLPFGSGSAPAAKGVITEMCTDSQRSDALNAVTLVENIARLSTQGLFGFIFASLAGVGKAYITFFCNAVSLKLRTARVVTDRHKGCCCYWNGCVALLTLPA